MSRIPKTDLYLSQVPVGNHAVLHPRCFKIEDILYHLRCVMGNQTAEAARVTS